MIDNVQNHDSLAQNEAIEALNKLSDQEKIQALEYIKSLKSISSDDPIRNKIPGEDR